MIVRLLFILLIFTSVSIGAEETYLKLSNSADEIAKAMVLKDQPFNLSTPAADTIKNVAINEKIISELTPACRENCDLKEKKKSPFELRAVLTWSSKRGKSFFKDDFSFSRYYELRELQNLYSKFGLKNFASLSDKEKLIRLRIQQSFFLNPTGPYSENMEKLKAAFINADSLGENVIPPEFFSTSGINSFSSTDLDQLLKEQQQSLLFFNLVNRFPNDKQGQMTFLQSASKEMSFDEKLKLVKFAGGIMSANYDTLRKDLNTKEGQEGAISLQQILEAERNGNKKGVCRDIALAQTQIMKGLGVNTCYSVVYLTDAAYHSRVACSDPNDRTKVHNLNYDKYSISEKVEGTEALNMKDGLRNHGIKYEIYDNEGRQVTTLPSEFLEVMRDQANFSRSDYNPMSKDQSTIQSVQLNLKKDGFLLKNAQVKLFRGTLSSGDELIGTMASVGLGIEGKYGKVNSTSAIGAAHIEMTLPPSALGYGMMSAFQEEPKKVIDNNLTIHHRIEMESPKLQVPITNASASLNATYLYDKLETSPNGKKRISDELEMVKTGIQIEQKYSSGSAHLGGEVLFERYLKNVSEGEFDGYYSPLQVIKADANYNLRDYELLAEGTIALRGALGTTIDTKATVKDNKRKQAMSIGYQGPIEGDVPYFISGAEKKIYVEGVQQDFLDHFDVKILYEYPLEKEIDPRVNLKFEGHL